jgi:uncharacterized protein (UPF0332 family)
MNSPVTAASYLQKAHRALEAARLLLANHDTEGACNRAYYAMSMPPMPLYAATGVQQLGDVVRTHGGLSSVFAREFVKTGMVGAEQGRAPAMSRKRACSPTTRPILPLTTTLKRRLHLPRSLSRLCAA